MGIAFDKAKITSSKVNGVIVSSLQITGSLEPIMTVSKFNRTATAQKAAAVPIKKSDDTYQTIWQPMGMDGWKVTIQGTLRYYEDTDHDGISPWLGINTGTLLYVRSNHCNRQGFEDSSKVPYDKLPNGTSWYVDKITISSTLSTHLASIEIQLYEATPTL